MRFRTIIVFCVLPVLGTVLGITATAQHCTIGELSVSGLRHSSVESRSVWNDLLSSASSTFGARPGLRGEGPSETPLQSESPVAERPPKDSPDAIAEWLVGAAREIPEGLQAFDEFAWRMLATGLPLLR